MRAARVKILKDECQRPLWRQGRIVNRYFAVWHDGLRWQLVHRATGVRTSYKDGCSQRQVVALARAATAKFGADVLTLKHHNALITALREAGSKEWVRAWFKAATARRVP